MWNRRKIIFYILLFLGGIILVVGYLAVSQKEQREVKYSVPSKQVEGISQAKFNEILKLCSGGDPESCLTVGYIHLRGVVGERDFGLARNYFEKACDGFKDPTQREIQCETIAKIFETGKEARVDKKISIVFHEKAQAAHLAAVSSPAVQAPDVNLESDKCSRGDIGICVELAEKYEYGRRGVTQDLDRAGKIYQQACEFGNGMACDLAGNFFRDKGSNSRVAKSMYQKGCKAGTQSACEHFKKLGGEEEAL